MQPLLHLASLLAPRGLRLTVVETPATTDLLAPLLAEHPSSVRSLSFPSTVDHDTSGPTSVGADFHARAAALRAPLGEWLRSHARSGSEHDVAADGRVVAVISDFFCGWTQPLAAEAGVPRLVFAPSRVLATAATHSLFRRMPRLPDGDAGRGYAVSFPALPGAPSFPWRQISRMYRSYAEGGRDEHSEAIKDNFLWNMEGAAFVCNTCHPLEGKYLDAQPLEDLASKSVWAVEPVAPPSVSTGEGDLAARDVNAWLDAFPDSSVAYVSFGIMMVPAPPHAAALAAVLERSGTPFVWAAATATLPDGFEDRAAAAGTRLVRVGLAASWGGFGAVPEADELARALAQVVGEAGAGMRARAVEIAAGMAEAIGEGGSSRRELDGLVQDLRELGRGR